LVWAWWESRNSVKLMECFLVVGFVIAAFGRDSLPFGGSDAHGFQSLSLSLSACCTCFCPHTLGDLAIRVEFCSLD